MKLLACHIDNFGRLSDFSYDFSEGINLINEENGWGKTTFAVFLKVMLYGMDPHKQSGAYDKERNIYAPWQGGTYGGTLDFEADGRSYRISRTFGKSEKTDVFRLYDLSTMLESTDYPANVGAQLFDLDSASFQRSIFIGQNDCTCDATDGIHAKLSNLMDNTNDINNYESARACIRGKLNQLSPLRVTGSIKRRRLLIDQLDAGIRSLDDAEEAYNALQQQLEERQDEMARLTAQREQLATDLEEASRKGASLEKRAQYDDLVAQDQELADKCKVYAEQFPAGLPEEEDLRKLTGTVRQMAEAESTIRNFTGEDDSEGEYERLRTQFADGMPEQDAVMEYIGKEQGVSLIREHLAIARQEEQRLVEQQEQREEELAEEKTSPSIGSIAGTILLVLAGLALVGSIVLRFVMDMVPMMRYAPAFGFICAGILCIIASVLFHVGRKQKVQRQEELGWLAAARGSQKEPLEEIRDRIAEYEEALAASETEVRMFLNQYHKEAEPEDYVSALYALSNDVERYGRVSQTEGSKEQAEEELATLQDQIDAFTEQYQITLEGDLADAVSDIQTRAAEYRMTQDNYDHAHSRLEQFMDANNVDRLLRETEGAQPLEEIHAAIRSNDEQIEQVRMDIGDYERQAQEIQQKLDKRDDLVEELKEQREQQEKEQQSYDIWECTLDFLQQAKESFTSRYRDTVTERFENYYNLLDEDATDEWQVDANIAVKMRQAGQMRDTYMLSAGYQDLIGFCMRLALADAMYQGQKPFLIMDDPFVNLDDAKVEAGLRLLGEIAGQYQVVYFTCHQSRSVA